MHLPLLIIPLLLASDLALGQTTATADPSVDLATAKPNLSGVETRTERIHIEDADAIIDELRVGGETKSISVQPKGGFPPYQVAPASGERTWKVLGF
jgi:hypothetical protein